MPYNLDTKFIINRIIATIAILLTIIPCTYAMDKNEDLLKDPDVRAIYIRATKSWFTKAGLKRADSLRAIGEKRKDPVILALSTEIRENYMFENGTEGEYYKASDQLIKAMKRAKLNYQYFLAMYSALIYDYNHDHTIHALRRAAQMQKEAIKSNDKNAMFIAFRSNGIVYEMRGNYPVAIDYLNKALALAKTININGKELAAVYSDLSYIHYSANEYQKGLETANKIISVCEGDEEMLCDAYSRKCHILYELKRYDEFMTNYAQLQKVLSHRPEFSKTLECIWAKALYLILKDNTAEAKKLVYALKSKEDSLDLEMTIAIKNGDYKKAYELNEKYYIYLQSKQNKLDQNEILEMSSEMGIAQLQNETAQLKANRQRMVNAIVSIVVLFVLVVALVGTIHIYKRRINRQRKKIIDERELFYRNVTHQLRTPMTVVLGMINQIKSHIINNEKVDIESVEAAERQSNNLLSLIKQLIDASKEGKLQEALLSPKGDIITAPSIDNDSAQDHHINKKSFAGFMSNGSSHILVAEDNDDVALLICNMLHDQGYSVTRAADGQEAWEMMQDELPDLLLTDIAMPRMDGLGLMHHIRNDETMSHMPIIVVSARVEDSERLEGIEAGAEVYLAKPFINEELILRVKKILEQRENLRKRFSSGEIEINDAEDKTEAHSEIKQTNKTIDVLNKDEKAFIAHINRLIDDNMSSGEVTTQFIAEETGLSVSTLNRKLKNLTGMASTIYIRYRRFIVAKNLLETTNKSVAEIEIFCGFSSQGYLTRLFKAETGLTPSEYRKEHKRA